MPANEKTEVSDAELWRSIPFDEQVWIDMAVDRGDKPEAAKRCLCYGKGFTIISAKRIVDQRSAELARRRIPKKK
jgi:hypothetical protein